MLICHRLFRCDEIMAMHLVIFAAICNVITDTEPCDVQKYSQKMVSMVHSTDIFDSPSFLSCP